MKKRHVWCALFFLVYLISSCSRAVLEDISPIVTESFSDGWKFHAGDDSLWVKSQYSDSLWLNISSLQTLKEQNLETSNRFGCFRKTITFSSSMQASIYKKGAVMFHLGKFASCEEVYVNGKLVANVGGYPDNIFGYLTDERHYLVMADELNINGENLIAIRFNEGWGDGGFLDKQVLTVSTADTKDKVLLDKKVSSENNIFLGTNPISVTARVENKNAWDIQGKLIANLTTDDYQPVQSDTIALSIDGNTTYAKALEYTNPQPGFYRYTIQLIMDTTLVCQSKFNVGYEPEKIVSPIDAQADFRAFWDKGLLDLAKVKPNYKLILQPDKSNDDYELYIVEMRSYGNELIRGYYAKPKKEGNFPARIECMGYGSSPYLPNMKWDGFAHFVLSTRGQGLNLASNRFGTWITYGLDNKENYYYKGAFLDVVRAIDFICSRPEVDAEKIAVTGGSQGGAFTFAAAALDKRVKAAAPRVPFLSDYPDYFKISPWPRSDMEAYMKNHPEIWWEEIYTLLSYFDIKNLAQWIECPLIMGIGVQDNVCPPHINFAAYNKVKSEKRWIAYPLYGHSVGKEYFGEVDKFFKEKLHVK